ncbi:MAG TPA: LptE family protein [Chitinophagales bacterium]|nr:LptE family protein [Chitinophagales bacterium]
MHNYTKAFFVVALSSILFSACKIYKFTDASIDPNIKSVNINTMQNLAAIQVPSISPLFVEKLQERFLRETNLKMVSDEGDIEFSGAIIDYHIDPVAITNVETVDQNRLTITVKIDFTNRIDPDKNFSSTFRESEIYEANMSSNQVDDEIASLVIDKLVQVIFNKAFVNW